MPEVSIASSSREPFGVVEHERSLGASAADASLPEVEGVVGADAEDDAMHHPVAGEPAGETRVLEEGDVGARRPTVVRVEEVVDGRVVLVDGLLDHPQPERVRVELDVLGRVARDARDVMDAVELHGRKLAEARQMSVSPWVRYHASIFPTVSPIAGESGPHATSGPPQRLKPDRRHFVCESVDFGFEARKVGHGER